MGILFIMESRSQIHLALLRKISNLPSTSNYRARFSQFKLKRSSIKFDFKSTLNPMPNLEKIITE